MKKVFFFFLSAAFFFIVTEASAATLYLLPEATRLGVGQEFNIDIKVNTEETFINSTEATLHFSNSILQLVSVDKVGSIFNFWVEEPVISNEAGTVRFIGGTAKGIPGDSLQILKLKFKTSGAGSADLTLSDATVTASDGKGTNVLSKIEGTNVNVDSKVIVPVKISPVASPLVSEAAPVKQPEKVVRKAILVKDLPQKPNVSVGLYPDQARWYNKVGEAIALWDVPDDIVKISIKLDQDPNTKLEISEKEVFTGKNFGPLAEGIWYIHVRFKDNIGWGPIAHYRIALDATAPLGFETLVSEGNTTDNPTPTLEFKTNDALSGLKEYDVRIDNGDVTKILISDFKGIFQLPLQTPGKRTIVIQAVDMAENRAENRVTIDILPIASPTITYVSKELFSNEEKGLTIKGTSLVDVNVLLAVHQKGTVALAHAIARSNASGNWEFTFDQAFKNGIYTVSVQSQDARGAVSTVVESSEIQVKNKPIIQIGFFQLDMSGAVILLLLILVAGFGGGILFYKRRQEKLALRVGFAEFEITKIFKLIQGDVEGLAKAYETPSASNQEYAMKKLRDNIQKMEAYIKKGVEKIKK